MGHLEVPGNSLQMFKKNSFKSREAILEIWGGEGRGGREREVRSQKSGCPVGARQAATKPGFKPEPPRPPATPSGNRSQESGVRIKECRRDVPLARFPMVGETKNRDRPLVPCPLPPTFP